MSVNEITTTDMAKFGSRERAIAGKLLSATGAGFPNDFEAESVVVMMNMHSGCVFLTNADFQVAMMNGDNLESFYTCPECGHEGFAEDMNHGGNSECERYLKDIGVTEDTDD